MCAASKRITLIDKVLTRFVKQSNSFMGRVLSILNSMSSKAPILPPSNDWLNRNIIPRDARRSFMWRQSEDRSKRKIGLKAIQERKSTLHVEL